jgi:ribonuclease HI
MAKQKFYVVWEGRQKGIFTNWDDCRRSTEGFTGAKYKSYATRSEAESAYAQNPAKHLYARKNKDEVARKPVGNFNRDSIAVDAACSGNPGPMEYRGVDITTSEQLFLMGPYQDGTNNIGEFLAIVHALAYLKQNGLPTKIIYTDSKIAIGWVKKKKCGTKLASTGRNDKLFEYIHRAEQWLHNNSYHNPILKWETKVWGEIPADFGRK